MAGTNAAAAKKALIDAIAALPGLDGVTVSYSVPRDLKRECVYGGSITGPVNLAAMKGSGRVKREETLTLQLHIRVTEPGHDTTETTDLRAATLSTHVEEYLAANTTVGGVTNLLKATVDGVDLDGWTDDEGATSVLTLVIGLHSYLT